MGVAGAIEGGVLTPTLGANSSGDLVVDRLENGFVVGTSGAVMGAVAGKVESSFTDSAQTTLVDKVKVKALAGAAGGTASGAVRAEGNAILQTGELASTRDLAYQLAGGVMAGVAGKVEGIVNPSLSDTVTGRITSSSIASATGGAAADAAKAEVAKKRSQSPSE
jgi:hypothetical protein